MVITAATAIVHTASSPGLDAAGDPPVCHSSHTPSNELALPLRDSYHGERS